MALVQARIPEEVKEEAERILKTLGLDMASAIRVFVSSVVLNKGLPFEVAIKDPFFAPPNMRRLERSIASLDAGKGSAHDLQEDHDIA
ncbi:type II toxin-antitoxin system RelB/DinJ family antitoxin [Aminomonas paucivorans]|uniref:Addiction module antitoxin, RelB/DinJ family n=1 Tax=Aminomonas paucivorans DSM 12260 TaxID=584708 RepID=E3CZC0_9BACT|nr:type II toxin-antitoxin system RelB/DinJ family antitoxin [Aminomonas paucivorans]EFQ24617.1 addiction module antitoxin, RelB/DinJ family [Aminomonas paucivorans DSM 12260]